MIIPAPRWLAVAVGIAGFALLGFWWPGAALLSVMLQAVWLAAFIRDGMAAGRWPVDVSRIAPPAFSEGRTFPVRYRWELGGTATQAIRVREWWPQPLGGGSLPERQVVLQPGFTDERVDIEPVRRGQGSGGRIALRRLGPWGLAWRQSRLDLPWNATVFPSLTGVARRGLPTQAERRREAGLRTARRPGEGRMFEGLREWVQGDDTRIIDWKATARRGKPMARIYEDERRQQVLLVLDAGRLLAAESDGIPRLERAIGAALRLAHAAVEQDDDIGILVFADTVQAFTPPRRGRRGLRAVLGALAAVEGRLEESNYPAAFRQLALRSRRRALTVLFTDVIDRAASSALVAQTGSLRPRHLPVAVTLRDPALERAATARPATEAEAFERAAAENLLQARSEALAIMRRQGVLVLDVPPDAAADAVVEGYHQLKRRGLL
ncbi:MAG TPA: DUF58 domain-containing protein [Gemmatimonadales bacterium]|nr:DUF58 domain-containing protein [Gemmatimonadales bacterium]